MQLLPRGAGDAVTSPAAGVTGSGSVSMQLLPRGAGDAVTSPAAGVTGSGSVTMQLLPRGAGAVTSPAVGVKGGSGPPGPGSGSSGTRRRTGGLSTPPPTLGRAAGGGAAEPAEQRLTGLEGDCVAGKRRGGRCAAAAVAWVSSRMLGSGVVVCGHVALLAVAPLRLSAVNCMRLGAFGRELRAFGWSCVSSFGAVGA